MVRETFRFSLDFERVHCYIDVVSIVKAAILGLVQGFTEFLPISSSGHLVLTETLLNVEPSGISFEVFVHFATLLAIICVFRKKVRKIVKSIFCGRIRFSSGKKKTVTVSDPNLKLFFLLCLATIPAAVVGYSMREGIEKIFKVPLFASCALLFTGFILYLTRFPFRHSNKINKVSVLDSVLIGIAQAVAILPGVSRSGMTISTGLFRGLDRKTSAEFSFLLAVPVIGGATFLQIKEGMGNIVQIGIVPLLFGSVFAFCSGYFAIKVVLKVLEKANFCLFAYYCWIVGIATIILIVLK